MKNLIKKILREGVDVPHHYQPTGHSCGPTCLKMVHDFFVGDRFKISDICRACGTDWVVGTPPDRMAKGLKHMGIQYVEHMMDEDPFQAIKDSIDKGHPCVVRTVTQGVPHWIIVVDYDHDTFMINDPWLGRILYDMDEFDDIWFSGRDKIREYFFYEITGGDKDVYPDEQMAPWEEDEGLENFDDEEDYMSENSEMWSQEWIENILNSAKEAVGDSSLTMEDMADFDDDTGHQNWQSDEELLRAFIDWYYGDYEEFEDDEDEEEEGFDDEDPRYGKQLSIHFPEPGEQLGLFPELEDEEHSFENMHDERYHPWDYMEDEKSTTNQVEISHFESEEEIIEALRIGLKSFAGQMEPKSLVTYLSKAGDWGISVKATYQGKIVGFYLLAESQMSDYLRHYMVRDYNCYSTEECNDKYPNSILVDPKEFETLDGVEGVALGVDPEYRGLGVGRKLIEYSQKLPYDYIWGQQYEHLDNIQHWTKRREVAAYFPGLYITYAYL